MDVYVFLDHHPDQDHSQGQSRHELHNKDHLHVSQNQPHVQDEILTVAGSGKGKKKGQTEVVREKGTDQGLCSFLKLVKLRTFISAAF